MVTIFFVILLVFTIAQRLSELRIADRNFVVLRARGAVEFGARHYWVFIVLHSLFFVSLIVEFVAHGESMPSFWPIPFIIFVLSQLGRVWVIKTMKGRWTTRVIVIKGEPLVESGPFRLLPHPNYTIVAIELIALPLVFGLTWTAVVFTVLNAVVLLAIRLPVEKAALQWSQEA